MKKICVLGGGAIGSCVSASLTDAGLDVILVDQWADHINKIRRDGLTVTTKEGEKNTKVSAYHMSDLAKLQPQFDLILMAVKAYDTQWVSKFASVYLKDKGVSSYTELIFLNQMWPDFNLNLLDTSINEFISRKRKFGGM